MFAVRSKLMVNEWLRTRKGNGFNESIQNLEEHMRQEHELGEDEHLTIILKANDSRTDVKAESANYTEIFNHIAQEINFVERSLSNSVLSLNLSAIIFIILAIK